MKRELGEGGGYKLTGKRGFIIWWCPRVCANCAWLFTVWDERLERFLSVFLHLCVSWSANNALSIIKINKYKSNCYAA